MRRRKRNGPLIRSIARCRPRLLAAPKGRSGHGSAIRPGLFAAFVLSVAAIACAPDPDDSGRGGPPVEPVSFIESADGPLWLGAPPAAAMIDAAVLGAAARSVVPLRAIGCGPVSNGTAFAVAPGLLIAGAHVIAGATAIEIDWPAGSAADLRTPEVRVVGFDETRDLALLQTGAMVPPIEIDRVRLGMNAAVVGYLPDGRLAAAPARIEHFVRASGLWGDGTARNVYVLAADVRTGQSGAPVVDRRGRAVGITFGAAQGPDQIGFALSRGEMLSFLVSSGIDARIDYTGRTVIRARPAELPTVPNGTC